jgi:hypothetical protein
MEPLYREFLSRISALDTVAWAPLYGAPTLGSIDTVQMGGVRTAERAARCPLIEKAAPAPTSSQPMWCALLCTSP